MSENTQQEQQDDLVLWYRYEDKLTASGVDEWGDSTGPGVVSIALRQFEVLRTTPKGVWLVPYYQFMGSCKKRNPEDLGIKHEARFVRAEARKQYASPTRGAALLAFQARKAAQARILASQLTRVNRALELAQRQQQELLAAERPVSAPLCAFSL